MIVRGQTMREQDSRGRIYVIPGENASRSFQLTMLRAFLLPPPCRDVYVLKEIQGYTLSEAAAVLGISKDDATKHLRRAVREMQNS